jgi:hypothetical protein
MILSLTILYQLARCHYAEFLILFVVLLSTDVLSAIMLGVVAPDSQHNKKMYDSHANMALSMQVSRFFVMLCIAMLSFVMLSVVAPFLTKSLLNISVLLV